MIKNLVSIIVPVYNVEKYLSACLDSILAQTFFNFEVVLVDDGSKDCSGKICDEYGARDSRIRVLHKENGGVSKARNAGLDMAQGEFVTFIDGDDTIDKAYIDLMFREMVENGYDVVRLSWERGGVNYTYHIKFDSEGKCLVDGESIQTLLLCTNIWGLFRANPQIRFNETLKNGEDSLFVIENFVKSNRRMHLINKPYYHYTIVEKSASDMSPTERLVAHKKLLDEVLKMNDLYPRIEFLVQRHALSDYFSVMRYMMDNSIQSDNGFTFREIESEVKALRKKGATFTNAKAELRFFLYRYRLIWLFKLLSGVRKLFR